MLRGRRGGEKEKEGEEARRRRRGGENDSSPVLFPCPTTRTPEGVDVAESRGRT
jgi:hypothetical protein